MCNFTGVGLDHTQNVGSEWLETLHHSCATVSTLQFMPPRQKSPKVLCPALPSCQKFRDLSQSASHVSIALTRLPWSVPGSGEQLHVWLPLACGMQFATTHTHTTHTHTHIMCMHADRTDLEDYRYITVGKFYIYSEIAHGEPHACLHCKVRVLDDAESGTGGQLSR